MRRRDFIATTVLPGLLPWQTQAIASSMPKLLGYRRTNWSRDPFSYGTYSYVAAGSKRRDHKRLAKPVAGKIFFAGEAANPDRNSSVHAALESGRLVAKKLIEAGMQNVGVIGAGISGLVAAHLLDQAGRNVHVIEARNRIGGRLHTDRSLGFAADLGTSWLHGSEGSPLTDVTDELGMRKSVFQSS